MARKSRRLSAGTEPQAVRENYCAALYARLSVEDQRKKENDSIGNQILLLESFAAKRPEITETAVFSDCGESGTNFARPAFQRMLAQMQAGKIQCVIVKDLSRLGRNYIETGNMIERVFPFLGVRFIAIQEQYDSAHAKNGEWALNLGFRNIMNEIYARDISTKVTTQLEAKRKRGDYLGAFAPYGYQKSPEDRHRLTPDPATAPIVKAIFSWRQAGLSGENIAKRLTAAGVPPPGRYRYEKGIVQDEKFRNASVWHRSAVRRILQNPVYLGDLAQGKQESSRFCGNVRREIPPAQWTVIHGTHAALIPAETFRAVQNIPCKGKHIAGKEGV